MLTIKHPKKEPIAPIRLTLRDLTELCQKIGGHIGPNSAILIKFQGTDKSDMSATDVSAIPIDDSTVPDVIVMPTIRATSTDGQSIELRPETVPGAGSNPAQETYVLAVTGASDVWAEGVTATTIQWLDRRRTTFYRYYYYIAVGAGIGGAVLIVLGIAPYVAGADGSTVVHTTRFVIPLLMAGIAFLVVALAFPKYYPRWSVVIRSKKPFINLVNVSLVVGLIASFFIIATGIASFLH